MRVFLALLLVVASFAAAPTAGAQPCYPDACCGSALDCLLWRVKDLLDRVAFDTVCTPTSEGVYACVGDPRGDCPVWVTDGYHLVCVL